MPLLGKKVFALSANALSKSPSKGSYLIEHTAETFSDKLKYEQVAGLYKQKIWTCQCTGKANLTHEEARKSEEFGRLLLSRSFHQHLEKPVLQMVHHDTRSIDNLAQDIAERLEHEIFIGDRVNFNVTSEGKTIWGTVISAEPNKVMKSVRILGEAASVNNVQDATKSKKVAFQYSVRLSEDNKIINSVPAEDLVRVSDRPSKNVLKQFIKSSAIRCGTSSNSPWVVNDDLVTKHSLTGKLVELLIPLHMVNEDGSEFRKRKVENSVPSAKKLKLNSSQVAPKKTKKAKRAKSDAAIKKYHEVAADVVEGNEILNADLKKGEMDAPNVLAATPKKSSPMKTELKLVLEDVRLSPDTKLNKLFKDADGKAAKKSKLDASGPKLNKSKNVKKKKFENVTQKNVSDDDVTVEKGASANSEKKMPESSPLKSKGRVLSKEVLNGHSPKENSEEKKTPLRQFSEAPSLRTPKNSTKKMPERVLNGHSPRANSENKLYPLHQLAITPSKSSPQKSTPRIALEGKFNDSPKGKSVAQPSLGELKEKLNTKVAEMEKLKKRKIEDFAAKCAKSKYPVVRLYDCMLSLKNLPNLKTWTYDMHTPMKRSLTNTGSNASGTLSNRKLKSGIKTVKIRSNASCSKTNSNANQAAWSVNLEKIFDAVIKAESNDVKVIDLTSDSPISDNSFESGSVDVVSLPAVPVKKVMKQMTLFDMKMNRPQVIAPRKDPTPEMPQKMQPVFKPFIDLNRAIEGIRLQQNAAYYRRRLVTCLNEEEIAALPPDVKLEVMATKERIKEKKLIANMTEMEKKEYFIQKHNNQKINPHNDVTKELVDDKCVVNAAPLPIPTMVPTPDNIPNELFGDVAMIVEFFNIYKDILMPEKLYPVTPDFIMTALGVGKDGFRYIANILMIALNVLIQDDCTQGFKEIQVPLLDLQLDINVAPELTRICLQLIQSKEPQVEDVPIEVIALLENSEMYELEPHQQLQIITCVCNLVLSTVAVQEYIEAKRIQNKECRKKQMDLWLKNKELKANSKENGPGDLQKECVAEDVVSESIEDLQGDDLVSTIRKRRQALARKSLLRDNDCSTPPQKVETPQYSLLEEIADNKSVVRVQCLGMDRNYSRYWVFPGYLYGLYVERGWATNCDDTQDCEAGMSTETLNESIPTSGQNLWFCYKSVDEIDALLKALNARGFRERALRWQLKRRYKEIIKCLAKKKFRGMEFVGSDGMQELITSFREKLESLESKLRKGNLGKIENVESWVKKLTKSETCETLGECLVDLQESIFPGFCAPLPGYYKNGSWKEIVASCTTLSRLHVLFGILDAQVLWERSTKNVKCNICRKKVEGRIIVICTDCSRAYHGMCLRPMLKAVPEGKWQCALCLPRQVRTNTRKRYGNESDYDSEKSDESEEEEEEEEIQCVVCDDNDNNNMVTCGKCKSSYHADCHVPNLHHLPRRGNWECDCCRRGKSRQARRKIIAELRSEVESMRKNSRTLRKRKPRN